MKMTFAAPCLFGLESILAGEVRRMGGEDVTVTDGRVTFTGDWTMLARANLTLRTAERVKSLLPYKNLRIKGLMTVLPVKAPEEMYRGMKELFDQVRQICPTAEFLSMGMSDDYETAIKCGANMIRPGTALFGERNYAKVKGE